VVKAVNNQVSVFLVVGEGSKQPSLGVSTTLNVVKAVNNQVLVFLLVGEGSKQPSLGVSSTCSW